MTGTDLARSDRVRARLASGYALRAGAPRPVRDRDLITLGAGAIYMTTADMARRVAALLACCRQLARELGVTASSRAGTNVMHSREQFPCWAALLTRST